MSYFVDYHSKQAMAQLKDTGLKHLVMLTRCDQATAKLADQEVGVTELRANLLPEDGRQGAVK